jgi:MFS family permease
LLVIGVWGIIPLAAGWVLTTNYWLLLILQIFAGSAWGAYELALMLLFFETIPERQRTAVLTLYNVANSIALVCGSAIGAAVLSVGGVTHTAYLMVFAVSTGLRALTAFWLYRLPRVDVPAAETVIRPLTMRPSSGSLDEPMLTTLPDQLAEDLEPAPKTVAGRRS